MNLLRPKPLSTGAQIAAHLLTFDWCGHFHHLSTCLLLGIVPRMLPKGSMVAALTGGFGVVFACFLTYLCRPSQLGRVKWTKPWGRR